MKKVFNLSLVLRNTRVNHVLFLSTITILFFCCLFLLKGKNFTSTVNAAAFPGFTPSQILKIYNLPANGGAGKTIAVIDSYHYSNLENDLSHFDSQLGVASCTIANGCLNITWPGKTSGTPEPPVPAAGSANAIWEEETTLDVEWAHAIAPQAKILLVETPDASVSNLMAGVDLARSTSGVVSISMSWGATEDAAEQSVIGSHFPPAAGISYFAATGDCGGEPVAGGPEWPSVISTVTAIGGTTLNVDSAGNFNAENAWGGHAAGTKCNGQSNPSYGSGGGISQYIVQPSYQSTYGLSGSKRSVPDVSANGDPATGYTIYFNGAMTVIGGTSASTPVWAAINTLASSNMTNDLLYTNAKSDYVGYYYDITLGVNGNCTTCSAKNGYDLVTGLGSPRNVPQNSPRSIACRTSGGTCTLSTTVPQCTAPLTNNTSDLSCGNPNSVVCCISGSSSTSPSSSPSNGPSSPPGPSNPPGSSGGPSPSGTGAFPTTIPGKCPPDTDTHTYSQVDPNGIHCYSHNPGLGFNTFDSGHYTCGPVLCPGENTSGLYPGHTCIVKEPDGNCYAGYGVSGFDDVNTYGGKDYCQRDASTPVTCPSPMDLYMHVKDANGTGVGNIQLQVEYADRGSNLGQIVQVTTNGQGDAVLSGKVYDGDHFTITPLDTTHTYGPATFGNKSNLGHEEMNTVWSCGMQSSPCTFTQLPPGTSVTPPTTADCFSCQTQSAANTWVCTDASHTNSQCATADLGSPMVCTQCQNNNNGGSGTITTSTAPPNIFIYSPDLTTTFIIFGVLAAIAIFL